MQESTLQDLPNDTITDKSNIRIPIGILAGAIFSLSLAFYAKIESDRFALITQVSELRDKTEREFSAIALRIDTKADKSSTQSRWTREDQALFEKALDIKHKSLNFRVESLRRENAIQHENLRAMLEHFERDIGKNNE